MDLRTRVVRPERMDAPDLDARQHQQALGGLRRINAWSRTAPTIASALVQLARRRGLSALRVLDVATGGGDVIDAVARHAARSGVRIEIFGCDKSAEAIANSRARYRDATATHWFVHDALSDDFPENYDVAMCTLFMHHLERDAAQQTLLRMAKAARLAVLVDDLIRCRAGYWLAWAGCRLLSRSQIVHYDGPLSVANAFTTAEFAAMSEEIGLAGTMQRHWPQRFLWRWERDV